MKLMITGHRPQHVTGWGFNNPEANIALCHALCAILELYESKYDDLIGITGMALGADQIFAEACIECNVPFIGYIPGSIEQQKSRWYDSSKRAYDKLIAQSHDLVFITAPTYFQTLMDRNSAMVDACDAAIAVWTGKKSGGTWDTVQKLQKTDKLVTVIDPSNYV